MERSGIAVRCSALFCFLGFDDVNNFLYFLRFGRYLSFRTFPKSEITILAAVRKRLCTLKSPAHGIAQGNI